MATRVGINGFGRVGRQTLRAIKKYHPEELEIVAINSPAPAETCARLLKYDSDYGRYAGTVEVSNNIMIIDGKPVQHTSESEIKNIPWKNAGVDIVIESAGKFRDRDLAAIHLEQGARKVVITAPVRAQNEDLTIVMGVNQDQYDPQKHHVVSNASCSVNYPI